MNYLRSLVDHPVALLFSLLISAPFIWVVATAFFRNIKEDVKEAVPYAFIGQLLGTWLVVKVMYFSIIAVVLVLFFYKIGAWFAQW